MQQKELESLSKFLSLILRHKPEAIGITLDAHGWADVDMLLQGMQKAGKEMNRDILLEIVQNDAKGRYCLNADCTLLRANQGHSIAVDVELEQPPPPQFLYHGTALRFLSAIKAEGLRSMSRLYVHLSKEQQSAYKVGQRHGKPIILRVAATQMYQDGYPFYLSANGVWLTKHVPPQYLEQL